MEQQQSNAPSPAFVGASWAALLIGFVAFIIGLWNADMQLNEKGYYFTVLLFGLYSAISVQKAVRDQIEGIPVTLLYYGISWFTTIAAIVLLTVGLWNADMTKSEKGFYAMAFTLSLFAAIAVQKIPAMPRHRQKKRKRNQLAGSDVLAPLLQQLWKHILCSIRPTATTKMRNHVLTRKPCTQPTHKRTWRVLCHR